ncbi:MULTISPECIES: YaeQ family protein [unclassified Dyella]|uniref:YaeQ family protein n=1 Tax=unclassified Dyella TaxID=2634549 RepID=UPI000C862904|nr:MULTISPECIES: YaeQ family protein [unclassified Dyella]MDR3443617.1 YaeQ family protein [Dyella sp.]
MALNATIYKVELQISNMDRHYYATHALTLARHPSETEARLMVRLLAFALYADDRLEFGKGLSDEDEPALWRKAYTDEIEQWIEVGQPDEARIRKACGRARQVAVINYGGRSADIWWNKAASSLGRSKNLAVLDIPETTVQQLTTLLNRGMRLQCLVQDGEIQLMDGETTVTVQPLARLGEYAAA